MTYGFTPELFVEDGPAIHAANASKARDFLRLARWRALDSEHRLEAVEHALKAPANDFIDDFPVAL